MKVDRPCDILLVEDSPSDVVLTREALRRAKIANELVVVDRGEDALRYLYGRPPFEQARRPDLVLLDVNLPGMSGLEVLDTIKSDPDLSRIPVVVLTTSAAEEDVGAAYARHVNAYVRKPIDFEAFLQTVRVVGDFWLAIVTLPGEAGQPG